MDIIEKKNKCNNCNKIFNQFDYLSHSEICYINPFNQFNNIDDYDADDETYDSVNNLNNQSTLSISYSLTYPNTTRHTSLNRNTTILEELMQLQLQNITSRMNNIIITNGISKNELYKYSELTYLSIPYECPICLVIQTNQQNLKVKCGHIFCIECSKKWFEYKPLCPICKCDIRY
jgi:hypothetical protein